MKSLDDEVTRRIKNNEGVAVGGGVKYLRVGSRHTYWFTAKDGNQYESSVVYGGELPEDYKKALSQGVKDKKNEVLCAVDGHPADKILNDEFCMRCQWSIDK